MGLHYDVNSRSDCNTEGNLRRPQPKIYFKVLLVYFLVLLQIDIVIECLVKVKKPLQKTVYDHSCSTSDPKRS